MSSVIPYLAIITKEKKNDSVFLASIEKSEDVKIIYNNFITGKP